MLVIKVSAWYNEKQSHSASQFFAKHIWYEARLSKCQQISEHCCPDSWYLTEDSHVQKCVWTCISARTNDSCGSVALCLTLISKQEYLIHFYKPGYQDFQLVFYFKQHIRCCSFPARNGRELVNYFGKVSVFFSHKLHFQQWPLLTLSKHAEKRELSV